MIKPLNIYEKEGANKALRIAVVGGGEAAEKALGALENTKIVSITHIICTQDQIGRLVLKAPQLMRDVKYLPFSEDLKNYHGLLNEKRVDAVYFATPTGTHVPLANGAIECGKHVLIEKPLGVSLSDIDKLRSPRSPEQIIAVAFKKRFSLITSKLRDFEMFKDPQISVLYKWHDKLPTSRWRFDPKCSGGGIIADLGSHVLDLLEYLLGPVEKIGADVTMSPTYKDIEISAKIALRFRSGQLAEIDLAWGDDISQGQTLSVMNSTGVNVFSWHRGRNGLDEVRYNDSNRTERYENRYEYINMFRAFKRATQKEVTPLPDVKAGRRNMALLLQARASVENQQQNSSALCQLVKEQC